MTQIQSFLVARQFAKTGRLDHAIEVAEKIRQPLLILDTIELCRWYADVGAHEKIVARLEPEFDQYPNNIVIPQQLATACSYLRRHEDCIRFAEISSARALIKFQYEWQTFTNIFQALAKKHETWSPVWLARSLHDFTTLNRAFTSASRWHQYAINYPYNQHAVRLDQGDCQRGYFYFERRPYNQHFNDCLMRYRYWRGESLRDKKILILGEQGIGDEILLSNCFHDIAHHAQKCFVTCDPRLQLLLQRTYPKLECIPCKQEDVKNLKINADYITLAGSLLYHLRKHESDFPTANNFILDHDRLDYYRHYLNKLSNYPKIGIAWRSLKDRGKLSPCIRQEYLELKNFKALFKIKNLTWINLQYHHCKDELQRCERKYGVKIHHIEGLDLFEDIDDLAHLMSSLDIIIAPNTTTQSLADRVNAHTWLLQTDIPLTPCPAYRNQHQISTPMMRNTKIFIKNKNESWEEVMIRIKKNLSDWLKDHGHATS